MANRHVEIHDLFKSQNGITNSTESKKSTSSLESSEDMVEFRILMAYAQRRRPKDTSQEIPSTPNGNNPTAQTEGIKAEKKKKKKKKIFKRLLTCLKPQTKDEIPSPCDGEMDTSTPTFRSGSLQVEGFEDCQIAVRLTEISDEIPFVPPEIETDSPEIETDSPDDEEVEKVIGLILRDAGDRLYETELKDKNITDLLGNYDFFEAVILSLLKRMGLSTNTESLGPKVSPKTQIAVACEATTRLSVLDTLPMNRLLGHGARFLKTHFSSWAEQQGGYEKAFYSEEDDEVH